MPLFSKQEFPNFVGHHGPWDIYANQNDICVALPVDPTTGHKPSMFGTLGQARRIIAGAIKMKGDLRCVEGRLFRHDPQFDDPELETDIAECPDCSGDGCDDDGEPVSKAGMRWPA